MADLLNKERKELLDYVKAHPVFDRILRGFSEKFASYGEFSGTVQLRNLSPSDIEDLEGFLLKNLHGRKSVTISAAGFEKALNESRFSGISPKELLEIYFQREMFGKKALAEIEKQRWKRVLEETKANTTDCLAETWIDDLLRNEGTYNYIYKRYLESGSDPDALRKILDLGVSILSGLPYRLDRTEYLSVFATRITGNPHAFDNGIREGHFLSLLLEWNQKNKFPRVEGPNVFQTIRRQEEYLNAGILPDDISNYVMLSGLRAYRADGSPHPGVSGFAECGEPVLAPLSVLVGWERVECPDNEIYIVENPSVFALLCRKWNWKKACMCLNGQVKLSGVVMLNLLLKAGVRIYYSGDLDPEGLLIAQRIRRHCGENACLWHMTPEDYEISRSDERISERRMKMLNRVKDPELMPTAEAILKGGTAGYQEKIFGNTDPLIDII